MLRGHVDRITATLISGWAVETACPDHPVDISIFINGRKLTQVTCDSPREDLSGKEGMGSGRHGFRYQPYPTLDGLQPRRVTIRHTNGKLLGNGDVLLGDSTATLPPDLGADLAAEYQRLAAPETPRQLFGLLSLFSRNQGLYTLLRQVDFTGRSPRQVAYSALGGPLPPDTNLPATWNADAARDLLNDLLRSVAFQQDVVRLLLEAYPEKRRLLFVHIPKCAGSDLSHHLVGRYPSIPEQWRDLNWTDNHLLVEGVSDLVRRLPFGDTIFVRGHLTLADYLDTGLARPCDRLFTILRDPVDIAISQVNYILTRLQADNAAGEFQPDTRQWLSLLELKDLPAALSDEVLRDIGRRALRALDVVVPNPMCRWLGGGNAETVLARLAEHEVEVTNVRAYPRWRREHWGIVEETRQNESIKFLTRDALATEELAYLSSISEEDRRLYAAVEQVLLRTERCAVTEWRGVPTKDMAAAA